MQLQTHVVRRGETLESIAEAYYGLPELDIYLFRHNTTVVDNPNQLYPGQIITIPHLPKGLFD